MSVFHDEKEIEDFQYDEDSGIYYYLWRLVSDHQGECTEVK